MNTKNACPICDDHYPDPDRRSLYCKLGYILVSIGVCKECYSLMAKDAQRKLKSSPLADMIRIRRGKGEL